MEMVPLLSKVAIRLLCLHATSRSAECNWSLWRSTCRDDPQRLGLRKVQTATVQLRLLDHVSPPSSCHCMQAEKLIFSATAAMNRKHVANTLEEFDVALLAELSIAEEVNDTQALSSDAELV